MKKRIGVVDVCGLPFTVYECTADSVPKIESCFGFCEVDKQEIYLEAGLGNAAWMNTLVHEILHGIIDHSGANLVAGLDYDRAEILIRVITPHLLAAIKSLKGLRVKK